MITAIAVLAAILGGPERLLPVLVTTGPGGQKQITAFNDAVMDEAKGLRETLAAFPEGYMLEAGTESYPMAYYLKLTAPSGESIKWSAPLSEKPKTAARELMYNVRMALKAVKTCGSILKPCEKK